MKMLHILAIKKIISQEYLEQLCDYATDSKEAKEVLIKKRETYLSGARNRYKSLKNI